MSFKMIYEFGKDGGQGLLVAHDDAGAEATVAGYRVIFDERKHGPLPIGIDPETCSMFGTELALDEKKVSAKAERIAAAAAKESAKSQERAKLSAIKEKLKKNQASSEELCLALAHLMEKMGD